MSDSKEAITEFRLVFADPDGRTSVVECRPKTGRTHQIRVHLQVWGAEGWEGDGRTRYKYICPCINISNHLCPCLDASPTIFRADSCLK